MPPNTATAIAHPNIAFIKYWGNRNNELRLPSNGSISMNLDGLFSHTRVTFDPILDMDELKLNGETSSPAAFNRARIILNRVRTLAGIKDQALVESYNNFPTGTGIASSASGFAALSLAASYAAGLQLEERDLSRLARIASGSACRSIPGGFVEWYAGINDQDSFSVSIASPQHWDLVDCIAIVSQTHKTTTSLEGHLLADTSPLQAARREGAPQRLEICRDAILKRDFASLAEVVELDSNMMHAVMITSKPPLLYWLPGTIEVMQLVRTWREEGLPVCYTIDAGPNIHVICLASVSHQVVSRLNQIESVHRVMTARPGGPAKLVD